MTVGQRKELRKIIHVDMDAFYASIEQRDRPALKGKPVIVGGMPRSRGVVCAASYEARKFGVHSAMPSAMAYRLCPKGVFLPPDFKRYAQVSREIRRIFHDVTDLVEPLSLDEAFLDVTEHRLDLSYASQIAKFIKQEIKKRTNLTASAGVGPSKLVAKIASDLEKPDGLVVVLPEQVDDFLAPLPVRRIWGVGTVTEKILQAMEILTISDLREVEASKLTESFGKFGLQLYDLARGKDDRPVITGHEMKSKGAERTFERDIESIDVMLTHLGQLCSEVASSLTNLPRWGRTLTIKVKYSDFTQITRSKTLEQPLSGRSEMERLATRLLIDSCHQELRPVRLLGVSLSNFLDPSVPYQLILPFPDLTGS